MKFRNPNEQVRVRLPAKNGYDWIYVDKGQTVDVPKHIGEGYGFEKVEEKKEKPKPKEGSHGGKKVETKKFKKKLQKIDGLGEKTSKDIMAVYPTEDDLKEAIDKGKHLPVRNDLENEVKKKFG